LLFYYSSRLVEKQNAFDSEVIMTSDTRKDITKYISKRSTY